jgi:SAM-dependent methyltransferase
MDITASEKTDVIGDGHDLPFGKRKFQCVLLINVLEHVQDPFKVIKEIGKILIPSGLLLLVVPMMFKVHPNPKDYWRFTEDGLKKILSKDYIIEDIVNIGTLPAVIWEIFLQMRFWELFRILNPVIARLPLYNSNYVLAYCVKARRRL